MKYLFSFAFLTLFACGSGTPDHATGADADSLTESVPAVDDGLSIEDYNPDDDEEALGNLIQVNNLVAGAEISSPFTVQGQARGTYFFEGTFPVTLRSMDGQPLLESYATSSENWMTEKFVPFEVTLTFDAPAGTVAHLVLQRANPSDNEGLDRSMIIPVVLE